MVESKTNVVVYAKKCESRSGDLIFNMQYNVSMFTYAGQQHMKEMCTGIRTVLVSNKCQLLHGSGTDFDLNHPHPWWR